MKEDLDIYTEEMNDEIIDEDEMSIQEMAFMQGYDAAGNEEIRFDEE